MVFIFEIDLTRRNGSRWSWKPTLFKTWWTQAKKSWRIGWGIFALSYYPNSGLRDFGESLKTKSWQSVQCHRTDLPSK